MNASIDSEPQRLTHSFPGLLRAAQIRPSKVVVYVEGTDADLYYYSSVLRETIKQLDITVDYRKSNEISGDGEGKPKCLAHYNALSLMGRLNSELDGKRTMHLFFLDKDIDDIEQCQISSKNVCYTEHCCVENHIVRESVISDSVASVISHTKETVAKEIGNEDRWLDACCTHWREWILICILSRISGGQVKNYGRRSRVQTLEHDPNSPTDVKKVSTLINLIQSGAAMSRLELDERVAQVEKILEGHMNSRTMDQVFKGKWYGAFLAELCKKLKGMKSCNEKAIWAALMCQVDPTKPGSERFREALRGLPT